MHDTTAYALYYDPDYLWVQSRADNQLYRMNHDGSNKTAVDAPGFLCCVGEKLYFQDIETGTLYGMDKHTLTYQELKKAAEPVLSP